MLAFLEAALVILGGASGSDNAEYYSPPETYDAATDEGSGFRSASFGTEQISGAEPVPMAKMDLGEEITAQASETITNQSLTYESAQIISAESSDASQTENSGPEANSGESFIFEDTTPITEAYTYQYSEQEMKYIARVVYAESRGEDFAGQVAVATVVMNRFESGKFGKTVKRVVLARNQFAVSRRYNDDCMTAVETAIAMKGMYPDDLYYFQVSKSKHWRNFEYYCRIGNHSFYCAAG